MLLLCIVEGNFTLSVTDTAFQSLKEVALPLCSPAVILSVKHLALNWYYTLAEPASREKCCSHFSSHQACY